MENKYAAPNANVPPLDINMATLDELCRIPSIDIEIAQALMKFRPFHTWSEIAQIPGISDERVLQMQREGARIS
jgi:DNA uptake protein ComE-like DNA-binding protein